MDLYISGASAKRKCPICFQKYLPTFCKSHPCGHITPFHLAEENDHPKISDAIRQTRFLMAHHTLPYGRPQSDNTTREEQSADDIMASETDRHHSADPISHTKKQPPRNGCKFFTYRPNGRHLLIRKTKTRKNRTLTAKKPKKKSNFVAIFSLLCRRVYTRRQTKFLKTTNQAFTNNDTTRFRQRK